MAISPAKAFGASCFEKPKNPTMFALPPQSCGGPSAPPHEHLHRMIPPYGRIQVTHENGNEAGTSEFHFPEHYEPEVNGFSLAGYRESGRDCLRRPYCHAFSAAM